MAMAMAMHLRFLHLATAIVLLIGHQPSPGSSRSLQDATVRERHDKWMSEYGREYKDAEERERRFAIFKANLERIETFNGASNELPYKLGLNQFADLTNEEFKASLRRSGKLHSVLGRDSDYVEHRHVAVPAAVDWREKGAVTPIKSSTCGSSAISAVEAVEGIHEIKTGELVSLSEQQLIDCYTKGCQGDGSAAGAFMYIIKNKGITTESNYPSTGANRTCNAKKESDHAAKISGYQDVPPNDEEALTAAVVGQPVSVGIDASSFSFQSYASGVLTGDCGTDIDHDVTIVGYGATSNGIKYWLVKNSWGTSWGEEGYIRLERDVKAKGGMCGIAIEASYPTVS